MSDLTLNQAELDQLEEILDQPVTPVGAILTEVKDFINTIILSRVDIALSEQED